MTTNSKLREDALTETWEDVEKLIFSTAHKFIAKYGSPEFEEAVGVGHHCYMRLMTPGNSHSYRREKGSFSNWLRFVFWHTLLEAKEKEALNHSRCPRDWSIDVAQHDGAGGARPGRLMELMDELTTDARIVVRLALDAPLDVKAAIQATAGKDKKTPGMPGVKAAIAEYLSDCGWTSQRINDCFDLIAGVLAGESRWLGRLKRNRPVQLQLF